MVFDHRFVQMAIQARRAVKRGSNGRRLVLMLMIQS